VISIGRVSAFASRAAELKEKVIDGVDTHVENVSKHIQSIDLID
jgi:hypothetical protein